MASTNGGLKAFAYFSSGLSLALIGALVASFASASANISRTDAQAMVDRGDDAIGKRLGRIEMKLDQLIASQGQGP